MNWNILTSEMQLLRLIEHSFEKPQVIFKHSTRCNISSLVKSRLERSYQPVNIDFYFLDLLAHRSLSHRIAEGFKTEHESPQILLIKKGVCVYEESHSGISMDEIVEKSIH